MRKGMVSVVLALAVSWVPAQAQGVDQDVLLYDSGSARALGMGNASTALTGDVSSVLWNPASAGRVVGRQLVISEALRSFPKSERFVAFANPIENGPSGAVYYLDVENPLYGIREQSFAYAFAQDMGDKLTVGATLKYGKFRRTGESKEKFNADLGALYHLSNTTTLGAAVLNVANPTILNETSPVAKAARLVNVGMVHRLDPQLQGARLGVAPRFYRTVLSAEVFDVTDQIRREVRFGVERHLTSKLAVRAGLLSDNPTVGLGIKVSDCTLNAGAVIGRKGNRATETMVSLTADL